MAAARVSVHLCRVFIKLECRLRPSHADLDSPGSLKPASLVGQWARVHVVIGWVVFGMLMKPNAPACAHDLLARYIQHTAHLTVGAKHLDLELELTFFEEESTKERQAMDADGDGRISSAEKESYLTRLAPTLRRSVTLRVGGSEVALTPLYEPELDLLANNRTGPGHHCLRLFLFASTPPHLRPGDEIVVEDRLWPAASSFGTMHTDGREGFKLQTESSLDRTTFRVDSLTKSFKTKCLLAPVKKTNLPDAIARKANEDLPSSRVHFAKPVGGPRK